jgi:conjugative relaxase-like TrwC/TraI family protein
MAQLTLKTGFDVDYYLDQVGADYYLSATGEPPGIWMGTGAESLGLAGEVDPEVMRALYHHDVGPDGEPLVLRQRKPRYDTTAAEERAREAIEAAVAALGRFVTPEKIREIELREKAQVRTLTPFYDYTLSAEKSVSLLYAGHLAAAKRARAEHLGQDAEQHEARARAIEQTLTETARELVALMEQKTAIVRTGHHSATTGEWRDAAGLVVASFLQHTNRDGEPNLHVQMTILNRARRADGADEKWRALDGSPLWAERLGLGALGTRILARRLAEQGIPLVQQASGFGFDVGGVEQETMDAFSTRTAAVNRRFAELRAEYEELYGHAPDRRALFMLRKRATVETRKAKSKAARDAEDELAGWMRRADDAAVQSLEQLPAIVAAYAAEHPPSGAPSTAERRRAVRIAVAEVQRQNATWTRSKLLFELQRALPMLPAGIDPVPYFEALADDALSGWNPDVEVIRIAPVPDVVDTSSLDHREDGTSIYRRPGEERFVTRPHLDAEEWILRTAISPVSQRLGEAAAAAHVARAGLDYHQAEAVMGFLTSRRLVNCLVAPAGTGKTRAMAAFSSAWIAETGCRVIGLTLSENAARVLAGEGMTETYNLAQFLGKIKDSDELRPHVPVYEGDVLVVDEATQVSTADLLRLMQIADRSGAMIIGTFDPEQLGAVEAGGMFPLITRRHGSRRLYDVRRFERAWEREASLKLRDGDITALLAYKGHGMVRDGDQARMHDDAVDGWLADHAEGKAALLLAASNEEGAALAGLARERLAERGLLARADEITLADGNAAGTGDLVRARLNTKIDAGGQTLSNRDTIKITGWHGTGAGRSATAVRQLGPGRWSAPFDVPAGYLEQNAELDYAGNVFVSQGRTVDTAHLVIGEDMSRDLLYVGMTRGREQNRMYVKTGPPEPETMSRRKREAFSRARVAEAVALLEAGDTKGALGVDLAPPGPESARPRAPWEAVVAQVLHKDDPLGTAIEQMKAAQDLTTNAGHLIQLSEAFWQIEVAPQIDEAVRQRIGAREYERYLADPERPALLQLLKTHEIGGRSIEDSLDAITGRGFEGARSIAGVLHGRLEKEPPPARGETATFAERVPGGAAPLTREAYQSADARQAQLGRQFAAAPEEWAMRAWGPPPAQPGALLDDWQQRAGLVGFYREMAGITDPKVAIGPVPTGQAAAREMFHASARALELAGEDAMLKAMGRGDLEARVRDYERAAAFAPADVTAELDSVTRQIGHTRTQAAAAAEAGDDRIARGADGLAGVLGERLTHLQVADAARREWVEAHAEPEAEARAAERELRARGSAERLQVTDAEVAVAAAQERETPAMDPAEWTRLKAQQTAQVEAGRQARREASARLTPVTDAEIARYGADHQPEASAGPEPEPDTGMAEVRQSVDAAAEAGARAPDREAERVAEINAVGENEPTAHERQAEPEIEPSWRHGEAGSYYEPEAWRAPEPVAEIEDVEPEMEA